MSSLPSLGPKQLQISDSAYADLGEIAGYLSDEAGETVARRFLERMEETLLDLAGTGHAGVSREWVSRGLRLQIHGDYCIYFRVSDEATCIVRILHGARDVAAIVFESSGGEDP